VYGIIAERRRTNEDTGDLLSLLMLTRDEETGEQMDDKQLRDEVLTMLVAGHETTATTLSWTFALLAQHPNVEQTLQAELARVLGGRIPTMADLPQLSYTRMVIDEVLRLYPPVYIFSRKVMKEDTIGGYRIPAGSSVDISPYITHRHPAFWDRPDAFEPERFAGELRHRFAYFPFSSGPRQCIGNNFALTEMQLVLATIAQRYQLHLLPNQQIEPEQLLTLRPRGGLPMVVKDRRS
jgi:cytochrome P450